MVKKIVSFATAILMLCCMIPAVVFADDVLDVCPKCGERTYETWQDFSTSVPDLGFPISIKRRHCTSCQYTYYDWNCMGYTGYKDFDSGSGNLIADYLKEWKDKTFGKNASAKKYETGGGSAGTGGVGRHPSGYADDTGTPSVNSSGAYTISAPLRLYPTRINTTSGGDSVSSLSLFDNYSVSNGNIAVVGSTTGIKVINGGSTDAYIIFGGGYRVNVPAAGYIGVSKGTKVYVGMGPRVRGSDDAKELWSIEHPYSISYNNVSGKSITEKSECFIYFGLTDSSILTSMSELTSSKIEASFSTALYDRSSNRYIVPKALTLWIPKNPETFFAYNSIPVFYVPSTTTINQTNNITINNNTWNGNIYQDNSTNLTYIYPQYTTVNENNETVTNISNNPIIYNNETKQYYTYDTVTNNYYYITYETPTPSPSPDPDPTPTPTPGGDTGDTNSLLDVLVQIRDNMIQGFADIKATLVQGWADLSANFTLAIENLNVNIQNFFNKKFPSETPNPSPSPSPFPEPVDPILPDTQNYIIPKMNSNTFTDEHGTWIASGSSKYSDVFDFFRAFDRSTSEIWETNVSPSYLQIEIPDPENYYIDGYIMRISKFDNRYAKDWTLQGSDDGETWNDLDTQAGQNLSDKAEHKYTLTLRKAYKYYRVNMSNYASSMCSLSHFNLLGYDAKDVVTPTPAPSPTPDPGTNPTPTPGGGTVPTPGGNNNSDNGSNISGGNDEGLFSWIWDLLKDLVKSILKAIFGILADILGFLIWIVERVGILLPFMPAPALAALGAGVVLIFVIRIIRFIRG